MLVFTLLAALASAQSLKIEGLEVLQCADVADTLEQNGYEWRYVQGEMFKNGIVGCEILLEKNNHQITVRGTMINGVFTVLEDKVSLIAKGDSDDSAMV